MPVVLPRGFVYAVGMRFHLLLRLLVGTLALAALGCGQTFVTDDDDSYGEDDDAADDDDVTDDDDSTDDDDDDTTGNQPPVADAGDTVVLDLGDTALLDGSESYDPDGDDLEYAWTLISEPPGSSAVLTGADTKYPTLTPTAVGAHHVELIVSDPDGLSSDDEVSVWAESDNQQPVADGGEDQTVDQGDAVQLDGSASVDPDGDVLSFWWTFTSFPGNSAPPLNGPSDEMPTFLAADAGIYLLELVVNDGQLSSVPDEVVISANAVSGGDDDDGGCLGCSGYVLEDLETGPLQASVTPSAAEPHDPRLAYLLMASACLIALWARRIR